MLTIIIYKTIVLMCVVSILMSSFGLWYTIIYYDILWYYITITVTFFILISKIPDATAAS